MSILGVVDGSGNATVISSESCVQAYGGGLGGEASSARGMGANSSGDGSWCSGAGCPICRYGEPPARMKAPRRLSYAV
jgi:hypothetical protein